MNWLLIGSDGGCRVSFPGSAGGTGVFCEGHLARLGSPGSVSSRSKVSSLHSSTRVTWKSARGSPRLVGKAPD